MSEIPLGRHKELLCHLIVLGVRILNRPDRVSVETKQYGTRIGKDDRRMGRDQELRAARSLKAMHNPQKAELTLGRKRRFGLIEDVNSPIKAVREQGQKRFTVRHVMKWAASVSAEPAVHPFEIGRKMIKAL